MRAVRAQTADIDDAFLQSILENKQLDPSLIEEYREITSDL